MSISFFHYVQFETDTENVTNILLSAHTSLIPLPNPRSRKLRESKKIEKKRERCNDYSYIVYSSMSYIWRDIFSVNLKKIKKPAYELIKYLNCSFKDAGTTTIT
jgi:hypothetical protein